MNKIKRFFRVFALMVILTIAAPSILPVGSFVVAEAATIKLNKKEITLEVGKSQTLKITGTKKKVTWSSNKKSVATVSSTGKVTGKKPGTAVITAKVDNKKYTCKVTVKKAATVNPYVTNAPFEALEEKIDKFSYVVPKSWKKEVLLEQGINALILYYPELESDAEINTGISLLITETNVEQYDISVLKTVLTEDYVKQTLAQSGLTGEITDFKQSEYNTTLGTALKTEYTVTYNDIKVKQAIYYLVIDNYLMSVTISDAGDDVTPDAFTAGEYMINSITVGK